MDTNTQRSPHEHVPGGAGRVEGVLSAARMLKRSQEGLTLQAQDGGVQQPTAVVRGSKGQ